MSHAGVTLGHRLVFPPPGPRFSTTGAGGRSSGSQRPYGGCDRVLRLGGDETSGGDFGTGGRRDGGRREGGEDRAGNDEKGRMLEVWEKVGFEGLYDRGSGGVFGEPEGRGGGKVKVRIAEDLGYPGHQYIFHIVRGLWKPIQFRFFSVSTMIIMVRASQ